jgi:uncharacterized protein (DUF1697 family)
MPRHVAFLRAINVGGRFVKMEALRAHFEALKLTDVQTFINSGNVIFSSAAKDATLLETKIEKHLAASLGFASETFLRSEDELVQVASLQPFSAKAVKGAHDLLVGFIKAPLSAEQHAVLMGLKSAVDDFHVAERCVYWLCGVSQHESKFNNAVFERKLKTVATWRRLSTVQSLLEKHFP